MWTRDLPDETGYYWCRNTSLPEHFPPMVAHVDNEGDLVTGTGDMARPADQCQHLEYWPDRLPEPDEIASATALAGVVTGSRRLEIATHLLAGGLPGLVSMESLSDKHIKAAVTVADRLIRINEKFDAPTTAPANAGIRLLETEVQE